MIVFFYNGAIQNLNKTTGRYAGCTTFLPVTYDLDGVAKVDNKPRAINKVPVSRSCNLAFTFLPRRRFLIVTASIAYRPSLINARRIKSVPKVINCPVTEPAEGEINCGMKARKKSAVFGFIASTMADW